MAQRLKQGKETGRKRGPQEMCHLRASCAFCETRSCLESRAGSHWFTGRNDQGGREKTGCEEASSAAYVQPRCNQLWPGRNCWRDLTQRIPAPPQKVTTQLAPMHCPHLGGPHTRIAALTPGARTQALGAGRG